MKCWDVSLPNAMTLLLTSDLHRDGTKLLWLLDEAPAHDALFVAGDLLDMFSNADLPSRA